MADYVKDYSGPNEMGAASNFIKGQFLEKNKVSSRTVFPHVTTAIDTSNVKFVWNSVVAMILEDNLKSSGLAG